MVLSETRLRFPRRGSGAAVSIEPAWSPTSETQRTDACGPRTWGRQAFAEALAGGMSLPLQVFVYLQVLDFLTTLLGLRLGASEASPFIRLLMRFGPAWGVLLSKVVALGLAAIVIGLRRVHLFRTLNYWYAALVVWNLFVLLQR